MREEVEVSPRIFSKSGKMKSNRTYKEEESTMIKRLIFAAGILCLFSPFQAFADYSVSVGYADNLRPSPFFPNPFSSGATYFNGGGSSFDAGAVMIKNTGISNITVDGLDVTLKPNISGGVSFNLWGVLSETLTPGQTAVFSQTGSYNFDTSDYGFVATNNPANNCSVGALSLTSICTTNAPLVAFKVDGVLKSFNDSGHVLDTGGFDSVNSSPCVGGNNKDNNPGSCNESLQWRLIGTTGVDNPGGGNSVPEPGSLLLLGSGLAGLALWGRKKSILN
ncbi:MAG: PEP-CTERM sorting domain-containing protein [Nitrospiria bacterium]